MKYILEKLTTIKVWKETILNIISAFILRYSLWKTTLNNLQNISQKPRELFVQLYAIMHTLSFDDSFWWNSLAIQLVFLEVAIPSLMTSGMEHYHISTSRKDVSSLKTRNISLFYYGNRECFEVYLATHTYVHMYRLIYILFLS